MKHQRLGFVLATLAAATACGSEGTVQPPPGDGDSAAEDAGAEQDGAPAESDGDPAQRNDAGQHDGDPGETLDAGQDASTPSCTGELCPSDLTFFAMGDCQYGGGPDANKNFLQISAMNSFPGRVWPDGLPSAGQPIATPRGVLVAGDITNSGRDGRPGDEANNQLGRFLSDYGLRGTEGLLRFPVYEGYGNHDFDPLEGDTGWRAYYTEAISPAVQAVIDRNPHRIGLTQTSNEGGHYAWDWGGIHFVNVNLFPGNEPSDHDATSMVRNPYHSLDFLAEDLAEHVGDSCRPVIVMSHYGFEGAALNPLWWKDNQREAFWQLAQRYNIIAYVHGHTHNTSLYTWNGIDMFNVGSPYYNVEENPEGWGHFAVFRIHDNVLEAADVAWNPNQVPARGEFLSPTSQSPRMGWRKSKTFKRTCDE